DGLNDADNCSLTGDPITYFQGVILGGLLDMATAEREWPTHTDHNAQTYIDEATTIADAVTTQLTTNDAFCPTCGAILTEPAFGDCSNSPDCPQFKGVFMRYLGRLDQGVPKFSFTTTGRYIDFIQNNASAVWANTRA